MRGTLLFMSWVTLQMAPYVAIAISIKTARSSHGSQNIFHVPTFAGVGVTSILPVPSTDGDYYVGTKRGKVKQVTLPARALNDALQDESQAIQVLDIEDTKGATLKPYPVFSMISVPINDNTTHDLLTGGGDRYITVWRKDKEDMVWMVEERLGPHTGWVKDLASCHCPSNSLPTNSPCAGDGTFIFSIGCNCIEVWSIADEGYKHEHKLQIESSVEMGSTLSSDLLCLATYSECGATGANTNYLFAGGVDGRIHRWAICNNEFAHAEATSSHDGRVNAMAVCKSLNVLISVGNDGCIQCRLMDNSNLSEWDVTTLNLADHDGFMEPSGSNASMAGRKITSLCIVQEEPKRAIIAVGTSCGNIVLINIVKSQNNDLQTSFLKDGAVIGLEDGEGSVIHALCNKQHNDDCRVMVGHSAGLSVWNFPSQ
ncbi:hypothetical protein ACHAXR_001804 [Thalassiosira sp. AJA248-18]